MSGTRAEDRPTPTAYTNPGRRVFLHKVANLAGIAADERPAVDLLWDAQAEGHVPAAHIDVAPDALQWVGFVERRRTVRGEQPVDCLPAVLGGHGRVHPQPGPSHPVRISARVGLLLERVADATGIQLRRIERHHRGGEVELEGR